MRVKLKTWMSRLNKELMAHLAQANQKILEGLAQDARKLCLEAAQTKETKNRTGAQNNSYCWLVCYDGIVKAVGYNENMVFYQKYGSGHKGLEGTWWKDSTGDDWIQPFLDALGKPLWSIGAKTGNAKGYEIYIINAAYYSGWLEEGNQNSPINFHKYRVISQIKNSCDAVASKYAKKLKTHAVVERLGIGYKPFKPASFSTNSE